MRCTAKQRCLVLNVWTFIPIVRSNLIDPQSPGIEAFQTPVNVKWLENTALRDMGFHEKHAACVDVRGDVFQWGDGFFGSKSDTRAPKATLRGKVGGPSSHIRITILIACASQNIINVQLTDSRVYALSASGRIYVVAANEERQKLPIHWTPSTTSWWIPGWLEREQQTIDFVEILPKEKLNWGETSVLLWRQISRAHCFSSALSR